MACGHPDELEVVRLPQTAYGPFDAAAPKAVAADAAVEASTPHVAQPHIGCWVPDEDPDEDEKMAPAPFDNCPLHHDGGRFDEQSTAHRRAHNRDICCYANMRREKVYRFREID